MRQWFGPAIRAIGLGAALVLPGGASAQEAAAQPLACLQLVEALANAGRVPLQGVYFDFNRASLRPDSLPAMIAARDAILTLGGSWTFEGHTDAVGSRDYNQRLSEARALAVRDWMVGAGVDPAVLAHAGYSFDRPIADNATEAGRALNRRVELVGVVNPDALGLGGPDGVDACPDTLTPGAHGPRGAQADAPPPPPPVTDWAGAGGPEWLPFSALTATALGGGAGWEGARLSMPPGTQPQACQALCLADDRCAAFSYEPAGSHFVVEARCVLIGYGSEMQLTRANGYYAAGDFWASGLKPDARLLTPDSEAVAAQILADMAEIAALRDRVRLTSADTAPTESWLDVALDGHVPADSYRSFVEIAELDDYDFHWSKSRGAIYVHDMTDGRSGQIWTPAPGDYVLRYGIEHPTAGMHTITAQALQVRADAPPQGAGTTPPAAPARLGSVEPGIDRPGQDIAQIPMTVADPLACQAVCAADPNCRAWTYVNPGLQGDAAICWTKSGVPDGFVNPCCTSGVMDQAAAPAQSGPADAASLDAPMVLAPGEVFRVTYSGPLFGGDWIDLITPGNDDDMSGGWAWSYVTGEPITLTAPVQEGDYTLRYVAEDPQTGRRVLARQTLAVRVPSAVMMPLAEIFIRCDGPAMTTCDVVLPDEDVALTLLSGFGITRPVPYATAAGVAADRPSFDVVRLSDGVVVISVNARQGGGNYCQVNMLGDQMCIIQIPDDGDAMVLGLVLGSLTSPAAKAEAMTGGDDAGHLDAGDAQGIWTAFVQDGPQAGRNFLRLDLIHDAGSAVVEGSFLFAADFPSLSGASGAVDGQLQDDSLTLRLHSDAGGGAVLALTRYGGADWLGTLSVGSAAYAVRVSLRAGPGEDWGGPLAWTDADPMAAALRMGAQALSGAVGGMSDDDRAFADLLGRAMGGVAGAIDTGGALSGDAAALLRELFGPKPVGGAGPAPSPQMNALGGAALDLSAAEALELLAPHLGE